MDYMTFLSENYVAIILVLVIVLMTIIGYFADKKYSGDAKPVEKKKDKKKKEKNKEEVNEAVDEFDIPTDLEPTVNEMEDLTNINNAVEPVEPLPVEEVESKNEEINSVEDIPAELFEGVEQKETLNEEVSSVEETPVMDDAIPVEESPVEDEATPVEESPVLDEATSIEETPVEDEAAPIDENVPESIAETSEEVKEESGVQDVIEDIDDWSTMEPTSTESSGVSYDEVETPVDTVENSEWNTINSLPIEEENTTDSNITFDGVADEEFNLPTIDKLNDELSKVESDDDDVWKF